MASRVRIRTQLGGNYFTQPKTNLEVIPTGCKILDLALGGGWVLGRIANIVGDKSTGKTLLCIEACANFLQKYPDGEIYYRESEAAFDQDYARALGMPVDRIQFGDPFDTVEDMFEDLQAVVAKKRRGPVLYILDSLDALSDREEMKRDLDKGSYGAEKAKKLSQMFRRIIRQLEEKRVAVIIVSQIRDKMNAMFGRKVTRSGGRALDFYATHIVYLAHLKKITSKFKGTTMATAVRVKAMIDKNKVAVAMREVEFEIRFGYGINDAECCIDFLEDMKALKLADMTGASADRFLTELDDMTGKEYRVAMKPVHDACVTAWYDREKAMAPKRSKYGA